MTASRITLIVCSFLVFVSFWCWEFVHLFKHRESALLGETVEIPLVAVFLLTVVAFFLAFHFFLFALSRTIGKGLLAPQGFLTTILAYNLVLEQTVLLYLIVMIIPSFPRRRVTGFAPEDITEFIAAGFHQALSKDTSIVLHLGLPAYTCCAVFVIFLAFFASLLLSVRSGGRRKTVVMLAGNVLLFAVVALLTRSLGGVIIF